jgi:TonB family protein
LIINYWGLKMKKQFLLITILTLLISSFLSAQNTNENCPPLYTRSILNNPSVQIIKIEVVDSNKLSSLPMFELNKDSIAKLIYYPEIAKRAGVQGNVIVRIDLDSNGALTKKSIIKGIGAGCDESVLDILRKLRYIPAKIEDKKIRSELEVWVKFELNEIRDEPELLFDKIIYEHKDLYFYKILTLNKSGEVIYIKHSKVTESEYEDVNEDHGTIPLDIYTRLNDFILSQCFLNYSSDYSETTSVHDAFERIGVKSNSIDKSVWSNSYSNDPVGLWAILNILRHIQDQITWEEVKE